VRYLIAILLLTAAISAAERVTNYDITITSDGEFFVVTYIWAEGPVENPTGLTAKIGGKIINVEVKNETFRVKSLADIRPTPEEMSD